MPESPIRRWQSMTTTEVERLVNRDPVVILPVAAIEQHGPHLPLSTDLDIGLGLLAAAFRRLEADFPAVALPPMAVGASLEHARFAGTLSLNPGLLDEMVYQQGIALHGAGVKRIVLSNSHGGNVAALQTASLRLREAHGLLVVKAHYFLFPPPDTVQLPSSEWRHGLHGGAVETAMMLHLHPDAVRRDSVRHHRSQAEVLEASLRLVGPEEPAASFSWLAGDLHPSGATGHAELGDREIGERLVDYYGGKLADIIRDAKAFPIDTLV